ncbi:MAG TPA: cation:proton antiporter [Polyangiaceae bacterium]|nr:cation:proton antiporter [Polyangiaceae bacterium]
MHDISLITTIALGCTAALFFGVLAKGAGLSPIVGYLLAGIAVGPYTPGFVGDGGLASQLAEIGVILLMFGVGLHFHLKDLLAVRAVAIPGALGQSLLATIAALAVARYFGWTTLQGAVLGLATAVASTVVLLRVLSDAGSLETPAGHVAVGWLIVEDIITVLVLVLLPAFAQAASADQVLRLAAVAMAKLLLLGGLVALIGTRFVPWLLHRVARLRSPELFTLSILVMSVAVATASYAAFGASMALGAFLAGMLVGQSKFSHQAASEMLPLRDAFAVLFFVSVGMLFDYRAVLEHPGLTVGVLLIILLVKPLVALALVLACRRGVRTALTVAGGLAQIGEFSFILMEVARSHELIPQEGRAIVVAGAIVSIALNPLVYRGLLALERPLQSLAFFQRLERASRTNLAHGNQQSQGDGRAVVVGYGPVGRSLSQLLRTANVDPLIVEMNIDTVTQLRAEGRTALYGDATRRELLEQAGLATARFLLITLPDPTTRLLVIAAARETNPELIIITRARYLTEQSTLLAAGADAVVCDETGAAAGLARCLMEHAGVPSEIVDREARRIREDLSGPPPAVQEG